MKPRRILALIEAGLEPPDRATAEELDEAPWRTEYYVIRALEELGHDVRVLQVGGELGPIRRAVEEFKPHVAFNLLERFEEVVHWDQNVVSYLELIKVKYTGCNARGMLLGRDKALTKKLLTFHRINVADFVIVPRRRRLRRPKRLEFPLIVKPLALDASIGISQASVVENEEKLAERIRFVHESVGMDAIVERYIPGRELYVGVIGNHRLHALPIWELDLDGMPEDRRIATERLKWSSAFQKRHGIVSYAADDLEPALAAKIHNICKRVYRILYMSGYARIDLRLTAEGEVFVLEANPNPQLASVDEFAEAAREGGIEYGPLLQRIVNLGLAWEPSEVY